MAGKTFRVVLVGNFLLAVLVLTVRPTQAAIITFQLLSVDPNQTVVEDGMRYTTTDNFVVRRFIGNPPSGLLGSPISNNTFTITRANNGDFTFDRYDFGSFAPGQQSDTWQFRGLLNGIQQFLFLDSTSAAFTTRVTNLSSIIDRLELSVVTGAAAAGVADNFIFTPARIPEPANLTLFATSIGLLVSLVVTGRRRPA